MSPYVLLDDGFHSNPKVLAAGLDGAGLYARALSFCGAYLTDGRISRPAMNTLAAGRDGRAALARCLVSGLIAEDADGYVIPDYLEINESAEQVRERRRKKQEAGRKGAAAKHLPGTSQASAVAPADQVPPVAPERAAVANEQLAGARPLPLPNPSTAEQSLSVVRPAALPDESLEELGQRLEAATSSERAGLLAAPEVGRGPGVNPGLSARSLGRAPYGSVDSVFEVIDRPAKNTRPELEKWLGQLEPHQVEHVREQTLACEPRKSKAAYAVGTAQKLARERGAA